MHSNLFIAGEPPGFPATPALSPQSASSRRGSEARAAICKGCYGAVVAERNTDASTQWHATAATTHHDIADS